MEKYLFLNPADVISAYNYPNCDRFLYANKKTLENLIRIVEETQCKIVIISDASNQLNSRGGDWTKVLNSQWLQLGYPSQISFFSATPVLWVADLKGLAYPVKSWKKQYEDSKNGIQVALWLGLNADNDDKYVIINRSQENKFLKNQKSQIVVCESTGLSDAQAQQVISMLNSEKR